MSAIENTYTGNGAATLYAITFPYINEADVFVEVAGAPYTNYTFNTATLLQFAAAPANGAAIRIYRATETDSVRATFYPGSAIRAQDLNSNFAQTLFAVQEAIGYVDEAEAAAESASADAAAAAADAAAAIAEAGDATTAAAAAQSTANTALSTANTANSTANAATATANAAANDADTALLAVSSALNYTFVANVAAIPGSPANLAAIHIIDSTGIQSFTPLAGLPGGFTGGSSKYVRLVYTTAGATWNWQGYGITDPIGYFEVADATILKDADIGVTVQAYDATILKSANLGVTVQAYNANILTSSAIGTTVQGYDATTLKSANIGTTVQGYDADTAKLDVSQSWTAAQAFNDSGGDVDFRIEGDTKDHLFFVDASTDRIGINRSGPVARLDLDGNFASNIVAVAALEIDCSAGNYFTKTIAGNSTFTVANVPASRVYAFTLELTHTSGTVTWFGGVQWPGGAAPTLTAGKVHLFTFVTDDGGGSWRAASQINYTT